MEVSSLLYFPILQNDDFIRLLEVLELVGHQDDSFVSEKASDTFPEEMPAHVDIHSRERIVQEESVRLPVHSPGQANPGLLSS